MRYLREKNMKSPAKVLDKVLFEKLNLQHAVDIYLIYGTFFTIRHAAECDKYRLF